MTVGIAASVANSWLDGLGNATNWTAPTAFWVKLHTGDPGSAGATAAAGETTRKQASFAAASAGTITTDADISWANVSTSETYSHVSYWTASTSGTFLGSDDLTTPRAVVAGDNFTIASGDIDLAITPVAA
jgi:hypothetical protein